MPHLLIYGDSNSFGTQPREAWGELPRLGDDERWPGVLAAALGPDWKVTPEALPGRTICSDDPTAGPWRNGLGVLPAVLGSHLPVDIVAVMLGTNDLKAMFGFTGFEVSECARRLLAEIPRHVPGARRLWIAPPVPYAAGLYGELYRGAETRGASLPEHLARVAGEEGAAFFDAGGVIACDPADGVHFRAPAHAALGRALVPVIRGLA
ncbi:Lysophospholipase L1 [Palleronia salina]|uniref:Lysophospholipase L1 n=1 Tax=Palleronia salina TaxID=313368 RepID=A0A1M6L4W1_9RHOB|nr:GDSL-type esterase/lipase family protein [Palleronia salina]SHJ66089.1 Lysophospholipase L1 [Palleronia salina]